MQASGSEITAGTAVYVDGALRFVTTEGDHLRTLLAAVRRPYMDPADADSRVVFAHELTLADGIYLTGSVSPYTEVVSALQANDGELLRVQIRRRERYEQELAYDTQIMEDDTLDFGKSETVQTGVPGRETVTYEVVYENGAEVDSRVLDVAALPSRCRRSSARGTRLQNGMIGKLGTGSFIWPCPPTGTFPAGRTLLPESTITVPWTLPHPTAPKFTPPTPEPWWNVPAIGAGATT